MTSVGERPPRGESDGGAGLGGGAGRGDAAAAAAATPASGAAVRRGGRQSLGLALRLARRMAWQSRGRSVLVVLLIALPIVGLAGIDTVAASRDASPADTIRLQLGRAQARLEVSSTPDPTLVQDPRTGEYLSGSGTGSGAFRDPADVLPTGTRIIRVVPTYIVAKTVGGLGSFSAFEGNVWDSSLTGKFRLLDGRPPAKADEILVSPGALTRLGVSIGGTVQVQSPRSESVTVVGVLQDSGVGDSTSVAYGAVGAFGAPTGQAALNQTEFYLPNAPLSWSEVKELNTQGIVALSRAVVLDPPPVSETAGTSGRDTGDPLLVLFVALLGVFSLFEVCLLAGAAFAVGARHRQRGLAILASVGADRRTLFAVMTTEGAVLGLLGGLLGSCIGVGVAGFAEPLISAGLAMQFPSFRVDLPVLGLIVLGALISGWIAAAFPARAASRVDVVGALRGARRPPVVSLRKPIVGVFIVAAGSVLSLAGALVVIGANQAQQVNQLVNRTGIGLLIAGPITMQIGAILIAPLLLRWVMRLLSRWGTGARLGSRDASRNPSRTVPALAAIMSTVFIASFCMCMLAGAQVQTIRTYPWSARLGQDQVGLYSYGQATSQSRLLSDRADDVASAFRATFPGTLPRVISTSPGDMHADLATPSATFVVPRLSSDGDQAGLLTGDTIVIGSVDDLAVLLGAPVSQKARDALNRGGAVATSEQYAAGGHLTLDTVAARSDGDYSDANPLRSVRVATTLQKPKEAPNLGLFLLPQTARTLGIPFTPSVVVDQVGTDVTRSQADQFSAALMVVDPGLSAYYESGPGAFGATWSWALLGLTTVIALGASIVAIALARADGRRDDDILAALGSPPRVQRSFGFWQGVIIAGLGAVIGVALGLVPALALGLKPAGAADAFIPFAPPWLQLGLTAVAMPLLIAAGGWLTVRRSRPGDVARSRRAAVG